MVLEAWVYKHFDAPFPNDHDKKLLASLTGMPRSQVRPGGWRRMLEGLKGFLFDSSGLSKTKHIGK